MNDMAGNGQRETNYVCTQCRRTTESNVLDYYWRDYIGLIPHDAIPGGHDLTNNTTYIGQGFGYRIGVLPGTIYPGRTGIKIPYNGANSSESCVKILCSSNRNSFSWENAESTNLHLTTIHKHLVIGGYEDGKIVNVGRATYQGELIVGKVVSYDAEKAKLCFIHGDKEVTVNSYQVLIYNPR